MDDRTWFCQKPSTVVAIATSWRRETSLLQLGENNSKADFSYFGAKKLAQHLQDEINKADIPGTIRSRIRILGTFTQCNRQHSGPNTHEANYIKTAKLILHWAKILPHSAVAKTTFAKATALGILATPNYSRLPALKELTTLTTKTTQIANNGISGPLARLLSGHAADPTYRAGYHTHSCYCSKRVPPQKCLANKADTGANCRHKKLAQTTRMDLWCTMDLDPLYVAHRIYPLQYSTTTGSHSDVPWHIQDRPVGPSPPHSMESKQVEAVPRHNNTPGIKWHLGSNTPSKHGNKQSPD